MRPHLEVYPDGKGEWRWRLRAANGEVVADSSEGYSDRVECYHAIERLLAIVETIRSESIPVERLEQERAG